MTARKTSLQIARLRDLGCKVGTVIGHWPEVGDYNYGVTLPDRVERAKVAAWSTPRVTVYLDRFSMSRIIVASHERQKAEPNLLGLNEEVAGVLRSIADNIENGA